MKDAIGTRAPGWKALAADRVRHDGSSRVDVGHVPDAEAARLQLGELLRRVGWNLADEDVVGIAGVVAEHVRGGRR